MKRIAKYLQLFLAPWMAVLMLAMLSLLLSSHVTAQIVGAEQFFGLHPQSMANFFDTLFIVGLILMFLVLMRDVIHFVSHEYGARIQQFFSLLVAPIRHRMTDRQFQWVIAVGVIGLTIGLLLLMVCTPSGKAPVPVPPTVNNLPFPGARVLLRFPVATPAEKAVWMRTKEELKESPHKMVVIPRIPMKTVTGPAVVRQVGPNTYEVHMIQRKGE